VAPSPASVSIVRGGSDQIDRLAPLYRALHLHQVAVAPALGSMPARTADNAWRRRREAYRRWLASPGAFVLVAERDGRAIGHAVVSFGGGYDGWGPGERIADLHDLAVLPDERGAGVGTALMDTLDKQLTAAGVEHLRLRVVAANDAALRFYERRGLTPVTQVLLGRVPRR
jgi:GNAT superfamily N-acetyltransferase